MEELKILMTEKCQNLLQAIAQMCSLLGFCHNDIYFKVLSQSTGFSFQVLSQSRGCSFQVLSQSSGFSFQVLSQSHFEAEMED